ncbi:MAG: hypothetical protein RIR62_3313 [Pseudomonadota bacterium]
MWPFAFFLLWPIIEIALFVTVGGAIGLGWTLLVIVATGALGVWLMRSQGLRTAERLRREMDALRNPLGPVADGALVLLAAALLVLPGFLTDALGLLLLLPPVRLALTAALARRIRPAQPRGAGDPFDVRARRGDIVIDGDYIEVEPDPDRRPSGWTRH